MKKLQKRYYGVLVSIVVFVIATGASYIVLNKAYGSEHPRIETAGEDASPVPSPRGNVNEYLAIGIGASMGIVSLAVWEGGSSVQQDTISIMLHSGLEDLTVRDLEIVRIMRRKEKFTIPELQKYSPASRQSIWRLVNKLDEKDLVEETGDKQLPSSGRGKPSKVYRYVGLQKND
ncbi:hypothetical protein AKJ56_01440 [candidate division MSBL1 archaeon SCGC-AAA382N08]|uniref:Helix-turn-helix type 11 domain-containing protein n=1 Tax=candidate division MSBL1 archaeon SCGC-AAA382N08 TaxID=1698285 RepID=A0A133VPQ6_9EURY|nr:hypothetical protein AKJ56_01440 [candidate division MSBL1 archaeon SCGC-AAA382N08]